MNTALDCCSHFSLQVSEHGQLPWSKHVLHIPHVGICSLASLLSFKVKENDVMMFFYFDHPPNEYYTLSIRVLVLMLYTSHMYLPRIEPSHASSHRPQHVLTELELTKFEAPACPSCSRRKAHLLAPLIKLVSHRHLFCPDPQLSLNRCIFLFLLFYLSSITLASLSYYKYPLP